MKASAFPKPSRGTNEVRGERQSTETLSFRCWRERCRLTRGAAFTLAEVLITLGIIGVVVAMTMPMLVQKHRKNVVETRLQKFYSSINQAIKLSEVQNGDKKYWTPENTEQFWNVYLKPYLKYTKIEDGTNKKKVYLPDGSAFWVWIYHSKNAEGEVIVKTNGGSFYFCPEAKYCVDFKSSSELNKILSTKIFAFAYWPDESNNIDAVLKEGLKYHNGKGVEPYLAWWDGKEETLRTNSSYGCNEKATSSVYCTAVIQHNGWRVPDDYPFKF